MNDAELAVLGEQDACKEMALERSTLPKPYYDHAGITIYHADCRDILPYLPKVDLVLTDPPYGLQGIAGSYGRHGDSIANDLDCTVRDWLIRNFTGPMLVFSSPRLAEPPGKWKYRLVWDKAEGGLNGGPWRYNHEPIFIRGDGWQRIDNESFSILRYRTGNGCVDRSDHPHKKPTNLILALMRHAPDGAILDPFMGSGTTLVAAKNLGRRAIGIEIEKKYCEIAVQRLAQEVLPLFASEEPKPEQLPLGLEATV
jgi:site-specific DNA-methyltransferase (adenine-specific)